MTCALPRLHSFVRYAMPWRMLKARIDTKIGNLCCSSYIATGMLGRRNCISPRAPATQISERSRFCMNDLFFAPVRLREREKGRKCCFLVWKYINQHRNNMFRFLFFDERNRGAYTRTRARACIILFLGCASGGRCLLSVMHCCTLW